MKILFYRWNTLNEELLLEAMLRMGHEVYVESTKCKDYMVDVDLMQKLIFLRAQCGAQAFFSVDFFPVVASVAEAIGIPYYVSCFDTAHWTLYSHQAKYPTNRIFIFDRLFTQQLKEAGVVGAYHLPLASTPDLLTKAMQADKAKTDYQSDVSFVGKIYDEPNDYYRMADDARRDAQMEAKLKDLVERKMFVYGRDVLYQDVSDEMIAYMQHLLQQELHDYFTIDPRELAIQMILAREITVRERIKMVETLSQKYDFALYTNSDTSDMPQVKNRGGVHYLREMPLVFRHSKINIQLTTRSIRTGLSLRVFDICACQGFLLSNAQEELEEFFRIGTEVEVYQNLEEMQDKIDFYLAHEDLRKKIAMAGYERVKKDYTYETMLNKIFEK